MRSGILFEKWLKAPNSLEEQTPPSLPSPVLPRLPQNLGSRLSSNPFSVASSRSIVNLWISPPFLRPIIQYF